MAGALALLRELELLPPPPPPPPPPVPPIDLGLADIGHLLGSAIIKPPEGLSRGLLVQQLLYLKDTQRRLTR